MPKIETNYININMEKTLPNLSDNNNIVFITNIFPAINGFSFLVTLIFATSLLLLQQTNEYYCLWIYTNCVQKLVFPFAVKSLYIKNPPPPAIPNINSNKMSEKKGSHVIVKPFSKPTLTNKFAFF